MILTRPRNIIACIILYFVAVEAQYDDTDYDFDFYGNFAINYKQKVNTEYSNADSNDFYISTDVNDFESNFYYDSQDSSNTINDVQYQIQNLKKEKVYRYTKHRIPGYDYEELDYLGTKNFQQCDEKSIWTHCLCQFTCLQPNMIDCYTPCKSGCECKENFVFDEEAQLCVAPDNCPNRNSI